MLKFRVEKERLVEELNDAIEFINDPIDCGDCLLEGSGKNVWIEADRSSICFTQAEFIDKFSGPVERVYSYYFHMAEISVSGIEKFEEYVHFSIEIYPRMAKKILAFLENIEEDQVCLIFSEASRYAYLTDLGENKILKLERY